MLSSDLTNPGKDMDNPNARLIVSGNPTMNEYLTTPIMSWEQADQIMQDQRAEIARLRIALADAIRRPMGIVPNSAYGLVTQDDLDAAEERRLT